MPAEDTERFHGEDIWQLADHFRNLMIGSAAAIAPRKDIPAVPLSEVESRRAAARAELVRRGFDDDQIEILQRGGLEANQVIKEFLASGGSRYG